MTIFSWICALFLAYKAIMLVVRLLKRDDANEVVDSVCGENKVQAEECLVEKIQTSSNVKGVDLFTILAQVNLRNLKIQLNENIFPTEYDIQCTRSLIEQIAYNPEYSDVSKNLNSRLDNIVNQTKDQNKTLGDDRQHKIGEYIGFKDSLMATEKSFDKVDGFISYVEQKTDNEQEVKETEYIEEFTACIAELGTLTDRERRILDKLRTSLGISEERARQLESSYTQNVMTPEELEYFEELKACMAEDGIISERERGLLNKIRDSLSISPKRAQEIEMSIA